MLLYLLVRSKDTWVCISLAIYEVKVLLRLLLQRRTGLRVKNQLVNKGRDGSVA